jgi:hypothetical protein
MSDFKNIGSQVYDQGIAVNSATQKATLGTVIEAKDTASTAYGAAEFIYLKGVASTVVGSVVLIDQDDFSTSLAVANDVGYLAVAMAATVAGEFGWYQITGKAVIKGLAGLADNASLYLTATAGSLDDAVVAGDRVKGYAKTASALDTPSTGLAEADIRNPFVDNAEAA